MQLSLATQLFDPDLAVEELDPREPQSPDGLLEGEEEAIAQAVEKRRREYTAGRLCARRALSRLGIERFPLLRDEERLPIWPEGICASLSHTREWCVAVAGRRGAGAGGLRSVGVDVEMDSDLRPALIDRICTPPERRWLETLPAEARGRVGKLIFSAKECAYKCQYPLSRRYLGFHAMRLRLDLQAHEFSAFFEFDVPPFREGDALEGRFLRARGLIVTGTTLREPAPPR
ncbi:MAG: 4'-phosphopantetheinyl transferase superfamily protein [Myxococcales bacterium]|nr:4'-phosphopantetheinyl transferase superfamily protein [Myxococcales bacterium]